MKILIIGSGGREHAFAWKISQSPHCSKLFIAPGNAGTATLGQNVPLSENDFEGLIGLVEKESIELILVGPEAPLVNGIRDVFQNHPATKNVILIGPDQKGAALEGSKDFAKKFMTDHGINTAAYRSFTAGNIEEAYLYLQQHIYPVVLKADGLAAGKGVLIVQDYDSAKAFAEEILMQNKFGEAGKKLVIEEYLPGIEVSVFVICDGEHYLILPEAKDYKRIGEGDTGLNTGGMGAVSPVPFADKEFMERVEKEIIQPTLSGLKKEKIDYQGFIFFGLMNVDGKPYLLEYNVRMGDPENEVVMMRLKSDLLELFLAVNQKKLNNFELAIDPKTALAMVLVSGGYPEQFEKGKVIRGLDQPYSEGVVFQAGTKMDDGGRVVTNGGRVMAVTALGENIPEVSRKVIDIAEQIEFDGKYFRKDIGKDLLSIADEKKI